MITARFFAISLILLMMTVSCGEPQNSPRNTVIQLFGAMERNDRAAVNDILDLPSLMEKGVEDYALQADTPRVFYSPDEILDDLTGEGETRKRWFSLQRIVGAADIKGDTAFVEISFVDKAKSIQYFNKFGLRKINGRWKIYSFRTM